MKHIDPLWTIAIPLLTLLFTPFVFGAAKPVPVNFNALRNPKRDMIWVAAAGPFANLLMMIGWAVVAKTMTLFPESLPVDFLYRVGLAGIVVNALLMVLNLFPLLPLDGGRILAGLLPDRLAYSFSRTEPYGMIILVILLATGVLGVLLGPVVNGSVNAVYSVLGLS